MSAALSLIEVKGESRVDTRILATGLNNQHKNVMELVDRYADHFKRFGIVPFKTEKLPGGGRGRPERYALLNEDQSYFLLSLSRNTDHVVELKANLVLAFKQARAGHAVVALEYLPGYHQLHDKLHELAAGSSNERFVHMNVNKLVNKTCGIESGQRDVLAAPSKAAVIVAQQVAAAALASANDHHDGYEKAKAALGTLGKALLGHAA